jgi:carboxypeptidase C (cathepsin A)
MFKKDVFIVLLFCIFSLAIFIAPSSHLWAQEPSQDTLSVTSHTIQIDGKPLSYTATAGTLQLKDENNKALANIFFIAYTKNGVADESRRPLLFSFNGGPGSSSVWLHLGLLGPRRVFYDDEGIAFQPPYRLVDNEYSILDAADVVFIDPVGTGYSRMAPGEDPNKYHGTMEDIESVGEFIRLYVTRFKRWESPKFIIGESYGTTRGAGLAGYLQRQNSYGKNNHMYLNGVILVSGRSIVDPPGSGDLATSLKIGDYTPPAWFHKKLPSDLLSKTLTEVLEETEKFAIEEYLPALIKGGRLTQDEKRAMAQKLSRYTGLSADFIMKSNLRIQTNDFRTELLRDKGLTLAGYDSRYTGIDPITATVWELGAAQANWLGPMSATVNHYLRAELKYETDLKYHVIETLPWRREPSVNVGEMLRQAMIQNDYLKVFIAKGYYDSGILTAKYCYDQLLPVQLKERVKLVYYEAGHMMYVRKICLIQMKKDLAEFIRSAVPE